MLGGFGSYLLGLNKRTYTQAGTDTDGNVPGSYKEPALDWMIGFLFVVSFVGLLALVPLRKVSCLSLPFAAMHLLVASFLGHKDTQIMVVSRFVMNSCLSLILILSEDDLQNFFQHLLPH